MLSLFLNSWELNLFEFISGKNWVMSAVQWEPLQLHVSVGAALSWLQWLEWEEGHQVFSRRERRKERQSGDLSKHMGVYSDPLHTDVSAAETARKQASTLLLPQLVLFFFCFILFLFALHCPALLFILLVYYFPLFLCLALCWSFCLSLPIWTITVK